MNFLAPWFLLGAAAIAVPILFHLIRRSARERVPFSSLLFLRPTPPRATRRRKLEHIALLCLRCLAILLLALGFARPFLPKSNASPPSASEGRQTLILLDTSASMRREGLWPKALDAAKHYLNKAQVADRLAIVAFDQQSRPLVSFADWSSWSPDQRTALATARLDAASPGWFGTQLGLALTTAAEQFAEANPNETAAGRDIILISDMQEGAKLDGLQGHDWPKGVRVMIERVDPRKPGNAGLEILNSNDGKGRQPRARIVNTRDSSQDKFQLTWIATNATPVGKPTPIYLPPGQTRTFLAPDFPTNIAAGALRLTGGDAFNDAAYFVAPETEHATIQYFGADSPNDPDQLRYYLQRAFPDSARRHVEITNAAAGSYSIAVIPGSLSEAEVKDVRVALTSGRTALLILTNMAPGPTLAALVGAADLDLAESTGDFALLGEIDFSHPIFAPFADPRFSDFSHIHFWRHRRLTIPSNLGARVLAKFDDGSPALAQIPVGKGSLLILTSGWNPADSQLALSSKFVPLLQSILDWSGGAVPTRSQFQIGESIPAPVATGDTLTWVKPDQKTIALAAGTPFPETDLPGIYSVSTPSGFKRFAVNLPLDESRTAPLSADDLARLCVPLETKIDAPVVNEFELKRHALQEELENRQKLWRWLIAGLLAVGFVEIILGGWLARRVAPVEVAS
jgi:hypothetical protein